MLPEIFTSVDAIFFDLDNTLIDRDTAFRNTLPHWIEQNAPGALRKDYEQMIHEIMVQDSSGHSDRNEFYAWMLKRFCKGNKSLLDLNDFFSEHIPTSVTVDDDINAMIKSISKNFLVGIISNGSSKTQRAKLHHSGLAGLFDKKAIYIEGEIGAAKPDQKIFNRVIQNHGISPSRMLFVGDHYEHDIIGAAACGVKTVWVRNGQEMPEAEVLPDYVIESIHYFKPYLIHA